MKSYKECKSKGYAYNVTALMQKHAILEEVTARIENVGHMLPRDNFLSTPELCDHKLLCYCQTNKK
jgi:hypothetical protein